MTTTMTSTMSPYLNFEGNAREAMTFYQGVFGGALDLLTFGQQGMPGMPEDGIMHAHLACDEGFTLMASDTPPDYPRAQGNAMSVSLSGPDAERLRGYWTKLADGADIVMPLERQVWGDESGQLVDRYGVPWMVNINSTPS